MRGLIVALLVLAMAVAGCSSAAPTGTPISNATALPTATATEPGPTTAEPTPTLLPTATPVPTHGVGTLDALPPGAAVEVAVKELNLRTDASTSAKKVATLKRGTILVISPIDGRSIGWGPGKKNGFTWYPVVVANALTTDGVLPALPLSPVDFTDEPVSGWVAADDGSKPYLALLPPRCPETVDLVNVEGMLPAERLACFGAPFDLEGTFGCSGCGGVAVGTFKPKWLADPQEFDLLSADVTAHFGPLALHFPPTGPDKPAQGSIIRATVHVSDDRSTRCSIVFEFGESVQADPRTTVFWCRERLVVESYEVLGTDPNFSE
jgi:hypothetical protein